jgi:hypothetical protein
MPTFLLYLKAELENVSKIEVPEGGRFCIDVSGSSSTAAAGSGVPVQQPQSAQHLGSLWSASVRI